MAEAKDQNDPKGLIREAFRIEGIGPEECRSIFFDWALSVPLGQDTKPMIEALLARYASEPQGHPMKAVLLDALSGPATPKRRGGRAARVPN